MLSKSKEPMGRFRETPETSFSAGQITSLESAMKNLHIRLSRPRTQSQGLSHQSPLPTSKTQLRYNIPCSTLQPYHGRRQSPPSLDIEHHSAQLEGQGRRHRVHQLSTNSSTLPCNEDLRTCPGKSDPSTGHNHPESMRLC